MPFAFISDKERIEPYMKEKSGPIGVLFFWKYKREKTKHHGLFEEKCAWTAQGCFRAHLFFGEELCEMIKRSRIILNLHFRPGNFTIGKRAASTIV